MRLGWLAALAASVALMVGALVAHTARQAERRGDRDEGLGAVAALSAAHVDAEIARVAAVLLASPVERPPAEIAAQLGEDVNVCVGVIAVSCTASEPLADTELVETAVADSGRATDPSIVTGRGDATDGVVAIAVTAHGRVLVAHVTTRRLLEVDTSLIPNSPLNTPRLVDTSLAGIGSGPSTREGRRLFTVPVESPFAGGERFVVASTSAPITASAGQRWALLLSFVVGSVVFVAALAALFAHHRRLSRRAASDDLTGLLTRREFERRARDVLDAARRERLPAAVIFIDLDGFKLVNDEAGHHVGDLVLKAIAALLSGIVRDSDVIARWGGDEFAMLLAGAGSVAAERRAAEIEAALSRLTTVAGRPVSASVGAAVFPRHGDDLAALMRAADTAMYDAKREGRVFGLAPT